MHDPYKKLPVKIKVLKNKQVDYSESYTISSKDMMKKMRRQTVSNILSAFSGRVNDGREDDENVKIDNSHIKPYIR